MKHPLPASIERRLIKTLKGIIIFKVEVKGWDWEKIDKIGKTRLKRLGKQDWKDWENKIEKIGKTRLKRLRKQDWKDWKDWKNKIE